MERLRRAAAVLLAAMIWPAAASACEIEDWRWYEDDLGDITIEGSTTCASGDLFIRACDSDTGEFLGTANGFIEGYVFMTWIRNPDIPDSLRIRYSIALR